MTTTTATTTATEQLAALWSDDNGMTLHGHCSYSLESAIRARPAATSHRTGIGGFERMTDEDVAELQTALADLPGFVVRCEVCS
jgi:hypothetical protein